MAGCRATTPRSFSDVAERTSLLHTLRTHRARADIFLADPRFFTVVDTDGIQTLHPWRYGRRPRHVDRMGYSDHR